MANREHLDILKQGVDAWNAWRKTYPGTQPDLSNADLSGTQLVLLTGGDVIGIDLSEANLSEAVLWGADLLAANLNKANLSRANLTRSQLIGTDLGAASLSEARLNLAIFNGAFLNGTNFSEAIVSSTIFVSTDLSLAIGLETVNHAGPSSIGIDTLYRSEGNIPEIFLRKAGVPDSSIEYMRSLIIKPIDYYTCFISYSSKDQSFAERLHADLQNVGVHCWFATEDMKIGDKMRVRIDESIRMYDKLLLVLSEHSVSSHWVEQEVETALAKEREGQPHMLFPIRLDETVMQMTGGWPALNRNTRHIGDFTRWKQHDDYQQAFERLLRDLKAGGNE